MIAAAEEPSLAELGWRLGALEEAGKLARSEMHTGFDAIRQGFVELRFYDAQYKALADKVESARALSMWNLGLLVALILTGLIGGLVQLALA